MNIEMVRTCDAAPVQYEGTIEGKYFYFRACWDEWSFTVTDSLEEAVDGFFKGEIFLRTGPYGDDQHPYVASHMSHQEAECLIQTCAEEYLSQKNREENVQR